MFGHKKQVVCVCACVCVRLLLASPPCLAKTATTHLNNLWLINRTTEPSVSTYTTLTINKSLADMIDSTGRNFEWGGVGGWEEMAARIVM